MNSFDENFIAEIIRRLKRKLGRELTEKELRVFTQKRSGLSYEMIMDYISDESISQGGVEE